MRRAAVLSILLSVCISSAASAAGFSFQGSFDRDDDVRFFNFTTGKSPDVLLRTWSYAGGVNAAGDTIARGGFDPILALFNRASGVLIDQNDDGYNEHVLTDLSGCQYDTWLHIGALAAGNYTVALMQFNNFAGVSLTDLSLLTNDPFFTRELTGHDDGKFWDVSGSEYARRDAHWAFDITGVELAEAGSAPPQVPVPEPGTMMLLCSGLAGLAVWRRTHTEVDHGDLSRSSS